MDLKRILAAQSDLINIEINKTHIERNNFANPESGFFREWIRNDDVFDLAMLEFFLWYFKQNSKFGKCKQKRILNKKYFNVLRNFLKKKTDSKIQENSRGKLFLVVPTNYGYKKPNKVGRIYSETSSLQSFPQFLKCLLLGENYVDLDLVNSSLSILLEYSLKKDLNENFNELTSYVKDRQSYIQVIVKEIVQNTERDEKRTLTKKELKNLETNVSQIIKSSFYIVSNIEPGKERIMKLPQVMVNRIKKLQIEVSIIRKHLISDKKTLQKLSIEKSTKDITVQSMYVQTVESRIIEWLFNELELNENQDSFIPMFDGLLFKKLEPSKSIDINKINKNLAEHFGFTYIKLKEKPFELDSDKLNGLTIFELLEIGKKYFKLKQKIEKNIENYPTIKNKRESCLNVDYKNNKDFHSFEVRKEFYLQSIQELENLIDLEILKELPELNKHLKLV